MQSGGVLKSPPGNQYIQSKDRPMNTPLKATLPDFGSQLFLTDGGIETCLIFQDGFELPGFAAFDLLRSWEGREGLARYYRRYLDIAVQNGTGFILESPTWRASPDWGERLGYSREGIAEANREAISLLRLLRAEYEGRISLTLVSGCIGPRGDGYDPGTIMTAGEATEYHAFQADALAEAGADMISAITMTNIPEAIGAARAAHRAGLPSVISFTVETDGRLPTGDTLAEAIAALDGLGEAAPVHYMINCAHPSHFEGALDPGAGWARRIRGLRTNASRLSHAELDQAEELDDGNPAELGAENVALGAILPELRVLGGCCGTDERHIAEMCKAWRAREAA